MGIDDKWQSGLFDSTSTMLAGWSVFALSLGVFLGAWLKRVVSAMAVTAGILGGLLVASFMYLVDWIISFGSLTTSRLSPIGLGIGNLGLPASFAPGAPHEGWLIRAWFSNSNGEPLNNSESLRIDQQLSSLSSTSFNPTHWLSIHHVVYHVSYQSTDGFVFLQIGSSGFLVLAACAFAFFTLRRIRSV